MRILTLRSIAVAILGIICSATASAQPLMLIPNQLSVGVGAVTDGRPAQTSAAFIFSAAWTDSGNDYWPYRAGLVIEGEGGQTSEAAPCQHRDPHAAEAPNCWDAAVFTGLRLGFYHRAERRALPFVNLLIGSYWKGSGVEEKEYESSHPVLVAGAGIDLRRARSVHALRLSLDYRHVFAGEAARNQVRFTVAYVLGPPRP